MDKGGPIWPFLDLGGGCDSEDRGHSIWDWKLIAGLLLRVDKECPVDLLG